MTEREKQLEALVERIMDAIWPRAYQTRADVPAILRDELVKAEGRGRLAAFSRLTVDMAGTGESSIPIDDAKRQGWLEAAEWWRKCDEAEKGAHPDWSWEDLMNPEDMEAEAERRYPEGDDARA